MSKRRRRKSSSRSFSVRKKRSGIRTFLETFMGVSIGLMILAFAGWWYFVRVPPEPITIAQVNSSVIKDNVVDNTLSFESIRDNGSLSEQKHLLSQLDKWPRGADTAVRIDTLSRRLEIAQTILNRDDLSENDRVATAKIELNAVGQIFAIGLIEKLDSEGQFYQQYLDIGEKYSNDSDPMLQKEARISKTKAIVYESAKDSKVNSIDQIQSSINSLVKSYPNDSLVVASVRIMAQRVHTIDPAAGIELMRSIVSNYRDAADEKVLSQIRSMKDEILLADSGISKVASQAVQTKQYDTYVEELGKLADYKEAGIEVINRIYRAISHFESVGRHDLALNILNRMKKNAAEKTDPIARQQALRIVKFGVIRNSQVGNQLDLSDTDSEGKPLSVDKFDKVPTLIVYFSPNDPVNNSLFAELSRLHSVVARTGLKIITISVDEPKSGAQDFGFNPAWDNISMNPNEPSEIFKRCPVTHVPFFALVDKQGVLSAINVPSSALKTRIELLSSSDFVSEEKQ